MNESECVCECRQTAHRNRLTSLCDQGHEWTECTTTSIETECSSCWSNITSVQYLKYCSTSVFIILLYCTTLQAYWLTDSTLKNKILVEIWFKACGALKTQQDQLKESFSYFVRLMEKMTHLKCKSNKEKISKVLVLVCFIPICYNSTKHFKYK